MSGFGKRYSAFDRFQQRHRSLGFLLAVRQKYGDDQGGYLAATIAYYGFFATFPLLLVFTATLGFVLQGHHQLQQAILNSALGQFPVIGRDLKTGALKGNALALGLGVTLALWSGSGVFLAAENAMNHLWGVPFKRRPDYFRARARALMLLLLLGGGALLTTALGGLGTIGAPLGVGWKVASIALSTMLNFGLFWVAFRLLTAYDVGWRCLRGGAAAAALLYEGLQLLGGYYVGHALKHAGNTYGRLRPRLRSTHLDLPRNTHHPARSRRQRRRQPPPLAAKLLHHLRTTRHQRRRTRAPATRESRRATPRPDHPGDLPTQHRRRQRRRVRVRPRNPSTARCASDVRSARIVKPPTFTDRAFRERKQDAPRTRTAAAG